MEAYIVSRDELLRLLDRAATEGYDLEAGSPLESMTIGQLRDLLDGRTDA